MAQPKNDVTFGTFIRDVREGHGDTQKYVAEQIGVSPQYMNDIELDRRNPPSDEKIGYLASVLNIRPDELFVLANRIPPDLRGYTWYLVAGFEEVRKEVSG